MRLRRPPALTLLLLLMPGLVVAGGADWSFEVKGGRFRSAEDQWSEFYGDDTFPAYALALGYRLQRQREVGVEAGYLADEGRGLAPGHGTITGRVRYWLYPLHLQLTLRGLFLPEQWLVPYLGAGWSRFSYRVEIPRQSEITGATDGFSRRAGLQLLLDKLDRSSASELKSSFGIVHTYLFVEAQQSEVSLGGTQLGGRATLGGLRFEF